MIIQMKGVSWIVGDTTNSARSNWTVQREEHWAIIGLNGSGKTSLLNMVNGYIWPSEGEIAFSADGLAGATSETCAEKLDGRVLHCRKNYM